MGLYIAHIRSGVYKTFEKAGIADMIGRDAFRENIADAMAVLEARQEHAWRGPQRVSSFLV